MITAITILSWLCLLLIFVKFEWGVGFYLMLFFLVPFYYLYLGGLTIGENLLSLILLLMFFVWSSNKGGLKKNCLSLVSPFLFLFLIQFILIPFHSSGMPINEQLMRFRIDIMRVFLPFVLLCIVDCNRRSASLFKYAMYLTIAITTLYGLFLISMPGRNPYIEAINPILKYDIRDQESVLGEGIRAFGYISSVCPHVTEYGFFLLFSSVYLLYHFKRDETIIPKILFGFVLICVITCGSRSVLLAEGVVLVVYLIYNHQFKVLISAIVLMTVAWLIMKHFLPSFVLFINSIGDGSISGSSIDMRWGQYRGCFDSLKENPVFGNGYGWTGWYRSTVGRHPTMLSFESCLIQILCNNGIMGLVVWVMFVVVVFKNISKHFKGNTELKEALSLLLIAYFGYTFFTGDYGTFRSMMIFYMLIVANEISCQNTAMQKECVPRGLSVNYMSNNKLTII